MGGESRFSFTSVWMISLSWKGVLQDLCFQAHGCKWEKMIVSPFWANTSADHSWLAASDLGHNISLCSLRCISAKMDDAFAHREPPRPLIVLCQVGEVPVIVSQHSTVEVCLCSLMVFFYACPACRLHMLYRFTLGELPKCGRG